MVQGRNLSKGERKLCYRVFKWSDIDTGNIDVVRRPKTMHFGGFTPYGRINMDGELYRDDYIGDDITIPIDVGLAHHFLHELAHSWQHLSGMAMMHLSRLSQKHGKAVRVANGKPKRPDGMSRDDWKDIKFDSVYSYDINSGADLLDFTLEHQCEIIADYWALELKWMLYAPKKKFGYPRPTKVQLEAVLDKFLKDRTYARFARPNNDWRARGRQLER